MSDFVYFYKNGDIYYENKNLINGTESSIFLNTIDVELINSNDVYYNSKKDTYYHKYILGQSYTFLEWKLGKDDTWDWYKCEYDTNDLINIKNNSIEKHTDYDALRKEISDSIHSIINKYDLSEIENTIKKHDLNDDINENLDIASELESLPHVVHTYIVDIDWENTLKVHLFFCILEILKVKLDWSLFHLTTTFI